MFTKNWYSALGQFLSDGHAGSKVVGYNSSEWVPATPTSSFFLIGASNVNNAYCPSMYFMRTTVASGSAGGVIIGDGDTAPTVNDYKLSGNLISTFTYSAAVTAEDTDDGVIITGLYTITNSGTETITIKEIGLVATPTNNSGLQYRLLIERTVLETPVTIEPSGVGQVTYTIRMNYPTA